MIVAHTWEATARQTPALSEPSIDTGKCQKCNGILQYCYTDYGGYWRCTSCGRRSVLTTTDNLEEVE